MTESAAGFHHAWPSWERAEPLFADAKCTSMVASKIGRTATCPLSAVAVLDGTCGSAHYFARGSTPALVFRVDASSACAVTEARGLLAYGLGSLIAAKSYEPVVTNDVGATRAQRRSLGGPVPDAPVAWTSVVDAQTGEPCDVVTAADGVLRCLPSLIEPPSYFADAACTEPAIARAITGCESGPDPKFVRDTQDAMPRAYEVVREISAIYTQGAKGCAPFAPSVRSRLLAVKEADPSHFMTATAGAD